MKQSLTWLPINYSFPGKKLRNLWKVGYPRVSSAHSLAHTYPQTQKQTPSIVYEQTSRVSKNIFCTQT